MKTIFILLMSIPLYHSLFAMTIDERIVTAQKNCLHAADEKVRKTECGIYQNLIAARDAQLKVLGTEHNNQPMP
jgi:hypothetical protein